MKFEHAVFGCAPAGIKLTQTRLDITEIQSEDGELITRDKAQKAYSQLKKPVVVSDDSWMIPGLNNFPGPYMKYMNEWFSVQDWLNLTHKLADRSIVLRQIVAYQDASEQKIFSFDIPGTLFDVARGESTYPHLSIVSFDGKQTVAELIEKHEDSLRESGNVWQQFAEWYRGYHS